MIFFCDNSRFQSALHCTAHRWRTTLTLFPAVRTLTVPRPKSWSTSTITFYPNRPASTSCPRSASIPPRQLLKASWTKCCGSPPRPRPKPSPNPTSLSCMPRAWPPRMRSTRPRIWMTIRCSFIAYLFEYLGKHAYSHHAQMSIIFIFLLPFKSSMLILFGNITWINLFIRAQGKSYENIHVFLYYWSLYYWFSIKLRDLFSTYV